MPNIQELAQGLRTYLRSGISRRSDITLVAHSLGGLIARHYLVSELKSGRDLLVKRLILYACPNFGAPIARWGNITSLRHRHLAQLAPGTDFITNLNDDWNNLEVEKTVDVHYVVAGSDRFVRPESARPPGGGDHYSTLIKYTHSTVLEATSFDDERYSVLKAFILGNKPRAPTFEAHSVAPDPFFIVYRKEHERYYLQRQTDLDVVAASRTSHIWMDGPSGSGKTVSIRRFASKADYDAAYLTLSNYHYSSTTSMLRALCIDLAERRGYAEPVPARFSEAELFAVFRKIIRLTIGARRMVIVIEEIPIVAEVKPLEVARIAFDLACSIDDDLTISGRAFIVLTSLIVEDPKGRSGTKFRERFSRLTLQPWSRCELSSLLTLLRPHTPRELTDTERDQIITASGGSPRFLKMVCRRFSVTPKKLQLSSLLAEIEVELS